MNNDAIKKGMETIAKKGCDRVTITWQGDAVPYQQAIEQYNIDVEIIFIREDGWTLGCHRSMLTNAYNSWKDEWIAVLIKPRADPISIDYFHKIGDEGVAKILPDAVQMHGKIQQPKIMKRTR